MVSEGSETSSEAKRSEYFALVAQRVQEVRQRIARAQSISEHRQNVTLVAVTKTHGADAVEAVWHAGVADVGENRVQEAEQKMAATAVPVRWHLIGHLQRNKARSALRFGLVHSIDSSKLAQSVNDAARAANCVQDVLMQVNVSGERSKGGFSADEASVFTAQLREFEHLRVVGVMTMAPIDAGPAQLRSVFAGARQLRDRLQNAGFRATELSMGMSSDFEVAIQEGATMVRLGSVLFGNRAVL